MEILALPIAGPNLQNNKSKKSQTTRKDHNDFNYNSSDNKNGEEDSIEGFFVNYFDSSDDSDIENLYSNDDEEEGYQSTDNENTDRDSENNSDEIRINNIHPEGSQPHVNCNIKLRINH